MKPTQTCPVCRNEFMQPFCCTTCGAQKLYDITLKTAHSRIAALEAEAEKRAKWNEELAKANDRLEEKLRAAEKRAEGLAKDARRYRFLRDNENAYPLFFISQRDPNNVVVQFKGELADMNIDAAVAGSKG